MYALHYHLPSVLERACLLAVATAVCVYIYDASADGMILVIPMLYLLYWLVSSPRCDVGVWIYVSEC